MSFTLVAPRTPDQACRLLAERPAGSAVALAGGTDLLNDLDEGRLAPQRVVSLRNLAWSRITWKGNALTIGSTAPLSDLESDPKTRARLPGLRSAVHAVGSLALRHRATIGGNLGRASPASDLIPILLALDARAAIVGPLGHREAPVNSLLEGPRAIALTPGELIESVTIDEAVPCAYVWQRVRPSNDISQVGVAVAGPGTSAGWRVALGGVWPRCRRIGEAEHRLVSPTPTETEIELAAQAATDHAQFVTDRRATEAYRRRLVGVLVRRAIRQALGSVGPKRAAPRRSRS